MAKPVFYTYILHSKKLHHFYIGHSTELKKRLYAHNSGKVVATKFGLPWILVWYGAFSTLKEAKDFELYLKSGSGRAFAYKRLVSEVLAKDINDR